MFPGCSNPDFTQMVALQQLIWCLLVCTSVGIEAHSMELLFYV